MKVTTRNTTKSHFLVRQARALLLGAALVLGASASAHAACDLQGADSGDVAGARDAIAAACPCNAATTPASYVGCANDVLAARVTQSLLVSSCRQVVLACARQSTCGRTGAVACLRTKNGTTRCSIERDAASCTVPRNGTARVGVGMQSCCDSEPSGCPPTPSPTPTPSGSCNPANFPQCTPAPCPTGPAGEPCSNCTYVCPLQCCPNGCGMICVAATPAP